MRVSDIFAYRRKPKQRNYRYDIFARDDYECWYCGRDLSGVDAISCNAEITIDHKYPQAQGGDESNENLVTCCRPCNLQKGNKTVEEFRAYIIQQCQKKIYEALDTYYKFARLLPNDDGFQEISDNLVVLDGNASRLALTFYGEKPHISPSESLSVINHESEYPQ